MIPRRIIAALSGGTLLAKVNKTVLYFVRGAGTQQAAVNKATLYVVIPPA